MERIVPELPAADEKIRLFVDSDTASEIDDLYAIALTLFRPDRFDIQGFSACHFAQKPDATPESIKSSFDLIETLLDKAGMKGKYPVAMGGNPMQYVKQPSDSDGARLIIEKAHEGSEDDPLWVVGIGAATNLASAIILDPSIKPKVRYVFHARSEQTWPERNEQYNVGGDLNAARALLYSDVPLVWFDTGEQLTCPMSVTEEKLKPLGGLPEFLHEYRYNSHYFQSENKGFFDVGDFAWMIDPSVCENDIVDTPWLDWVMHFRHDGKHGQMLRVHHIKAEPTWDIFFSAMQKNKM